MHTTVHDICCPQQTLPAMIGEIQVSQRSLESSVMKTQKSIRSRFTNYKVTKDSWKRQELTPVNTNRNSLMWLLRCHHWDLGSWQEFWFLYVSPWHTLKGNNAWRWKAPIPFIYTPVSSFCLTCFPHSFLIHAEEKVNHCLRIRNTSNLRVSFEFQTLDPAKIDRTERMILCWPLLHFLL